MSLISSTVLVDGTVSATGGTSRTFKSLGDNGSEHKMFIDESLSYSLRKEVDFSTRAPKVSPSAPGGYTQGRRKAFIRIPRTFANGNRTVDTVMMEVSTDVEATDAEIQTYLGIAAQVLTDSDYTDFWTDLSLA